MATDRAPELPLLPRGEAGALRPRKGERETAPQSTPPGLPIELRRDRPGS